MTPNQIDEFLSKNSFFNPNWTKDQVISGVEQAYQELTKKGVTGLQDFELHGETIKFFIKSDGTFDTAYGSHKLDNNIFD